MTTTSAARLSRLLALVPWLQAHPGVTLDECAHHFGIGVDQLESDLWMIVVCGVPGYGPDQLVDIQFWDDGRIHVLDALTLDAPLRLTADEAITLLVGLRLLAQVPGIEERSALVSAAAKLESVAAGGSDSIAVIVPVDESIRASIDAAITSGGALSIEYAAATRDEVTTRIVIPESVHAVDGLAYLEAWCTLAGARRTFRIDRILTAVQVAIPTEVDGAADPASVDLPSQPQATVRWLVAPAARWVIDVLPGVEVLTPGVGEERSDGLLEVSVPVHDPQWAARFVLSQGGAITALWPSTHVESVAAAAQQALASYS